MHIHCKDGFPSGYSSAKKSKGKYPDPQQSKSHPSIVEYAVWEYDIKGSKCKLKSFCHSGAGAANCVSPAFATILVGSGEYTLGACTNKTSVYSGPTGLDSDFSL